MAIYKKNKKVIGLYKNGNPIATLIKSGHLITISDNQVDENAWVVFPTEKFNKIRYIDGASITYSDNMIVFGETRNTKPEDSTYLLKASLGGFYVIDGQNTTSIAVGGEYTFSTYLYVIGVMENAPYWRFEYWSEKDEAWKPLAAYQLQEDVIEMLCQNGGAFAEGFDVTATYDWEYDFCGAINYDPDSVTTQTSGSTLTCTPAIFGPEVMTKSVKLMDSGIRRLSSLKFSQSLTNLKNGKLEINKIPDTRFITDMSRMFVLNASNINTSGMITSAATTMNKMFSNGFSGFTSIDVSSFDTSNVTDMSGMFSGCSAVTSLDISHFDTSNVISGNSMFGNCKKLTSLTLPDKMFGDKTTTINGMFYNCSGLTSIDLSKIDTHNISSMYGIFEGCSNLTSIDISSWDVSKLNNISAMFKGCSKITNLDDAIVKLGDAPLTTIAHQSHSGGLFEGCSSLISVDLKPFAGKQFSQLYRLFYNCSGLTSLDVSNFNTSKVTNMSFMFYGCNGLTSLDVSNFNTSATTSVASMFYNCSGLTSLDVSNFNTSKVTNMSFMFYGCKGLTSLDLSNFNTSKVTDISYMFSGCTNLTSLDVSNFNTSNVTNMNSMFDYCSGLTSLDVSNFNTSKVTNMVGMFYGCKGLTSLDVSNFNTSATTSVASMFRDCSGLTSLDVSNFNTSNVTNMNVMFSGCTNLTSLDLSGWDMGKVTTDMKNVFTGCSALQTIYARGCSSDTVTKLQTLLDEASLTATIVTN